MSEWLSFLATSAVPLLVGITILLALGWLGMRVLQSPISRQRLGELTLVLSLCWILTPLLPDFERVQISDVVPQAWRSDSRESTGSQPSVSPQSLARTPVVVREHLRSGDLQAEAPIAVETPSQAQTSKHVRATNASKIATKNRVDERSQREEIVQVGEGTSGQRPVVEAKALPDSRAAAPISPVVETTLAFGRYTRLQIICWLYLIGVVLVLGWLGMGTLLLWRRVYRSQPIADPYSDFVQSMAGRRPRMLVSTECRRVISFGLFRPTIVVPESLVAQGDPSHVRQVLLHELGHVRQWDAVGQLIMNIALIFLYFHPLYWLVRKQICFDRELVVDDWAARQTDKGDYASAMIWLAKQQSVPVRGLSIVMSAVDVKQSIFFRRINMLVKRSSELATRRTMVASVVQTAVMLAVVGVMGLFVSVPSALGQDSKDEKIDRLVAQIQSMEDERKSLMNQLVKAEEFSAKMQNQVRELADRLEQVENRHQRDARVRDADVSTADAAAAAGTSDETVAESAAGSDAKARMGNRTGVASRDNELSTASQVGQQLRDSRLSLATGSQRLPESGTPVRTASNQNRVAVSNSTFPGTSAIELTRFASEYSDAYVGLEIAKAEFEGLSEQFGRGGAAKHELRIASVKMKAAEKKVEIFRQVAHSLGSRTEMNLKQKADELKRTEALVKKGFVPQGELLSLEIQIQELSSTLKILQQIVSQ